MELDRDQIIHDLNSLTVKIKSIFTLMMDEDSGLDTHQMILDGDQSLKELTDLWNRLKRIQ